MLVNVRACLLNVSAENRAKSCLKKVTRRVVSSYSISSLNVNSKSKHVANLYASGFDTYLVDIYTVVLLRVGNCKACAL
jgi:hypothetical protein